MGNAGNSSSSPGGCVSEAFIVEVGRAAMAESAPTIDRPIDLSTPQVELESPL